MGTEAQREMSPQIYRLDVEYAPCAGVLLLLCVGKISPPFQ